VVNGGARSGLKCLPAQIDHGMTIYILPRIGYLTHSWNMLTSSHDVVAKRMDATREMPDIIGDRPPFCLIKIRSAFTV
jgi:hypothetical protein